MGKNISRWVMLDSWIQEAQELLNLAHWRITVIRDAADVEAWADIAPHSQANTAELRIAHDFWNQTAQKQREILTHEMLHLVMARADQVVESLEEPMGKVAWAVFSPQYENASEQTVDHIAVVMAPYLSLPSFGKE